MPKYNAIIEKFNPYHDARGRFTSKGRESSFTTQTKDPSKQHWADMAMERAKQRVSGYGQREGFHTWIRQDIAGEEWNQDWNNAGGSSQDFIDTIDKYVPNMDKIVETMQSREEWYSGAATKKPSDSTNFRDGDPGLHAIQEVNGFDGQPKTVSHSDFEAELTSQGKGARELYRGFDTKTESDGSTKLTGQEKAGAFIYGSNYSGFGLMGNGTQVTTNKQRAVDSSDGSSGSVVRMTLTKDARGATAAAIADLRDSADYSAEMTLKDKTLTENQRTKIENFRNIVCSDNGSFAAAMGYDYIATGDGSGETGSLDYIILNRSKVIVDEGQWQTDANGLKLK